MARLHKRGNPSSIHQDPFLPVIFKPMGKRSYGDNDPIASSDHSRRKLLRISNRTQPNICCKAGRPDILKSGDGHNELLLRNGAEFELPKEAVDDLTNQELIRSFAKEEGSSSDSPTRTEDCVKERVTIRHMKGATILSAKVIRNIGAQNGVQQGRHCDIFEPPPAAGKLMVELSAVGDEPSHLWGFETATNTKPDLIRILRYTPSPGGLPNGPRLYVLYTTEAIDEATKMEVIEAAKTVELPLGYGNNET